MSLISLYLSKTIFSLFVWTFCDSSLVSFWPCDDEGPVGDVVNLLVAGGEYVIMMVALSSISLSTSTLRVNFVLSL